MHKDNIKKVQIETVKIITETEKIIDNLLDIEKTNIESSDSKKTLSYKNLTKHKDILGNEKKKLIEPEYVVAVVGTMKAGKSMTINAIVGQEVLPSRKLPMTTLPTLITHKAKQEKPILKLKNIEPFKNLVTKIKKSNICEKEYKQEELKNLLDKIKKDKITFNTVYNGKNEINIFLEVLNDLMRIANDFNIEPPYEEFTNIDELPRIEVEFYHLLNKENYMNTKLTLLDTPGPDEFKHSKMLKEIFIKQIERASAVMLLVDYDKMNSNSGAEVKKEVEEVANKNHLLVLVNKFEGEDKEEAKKEEAKKLVAKDMFKGEMNIDSIYPVSAKIALYANLGLCELHKHGKIDKSLSWFDEFGKTLFGPSWDIMKNSTNDELLETICKNSWKKSFFEEPLNNISTIHRDALFLTLESALDSLENSLKDYSNAFKIHKESYDKKLKDLKKDIESLKKDIEILAIISKNIQNSSTNLLKDSKNKISRTIKDNVEQVKNKIVDNFNNNLEKAYTEEKNLGHKTEDRIVLWEGVFLMYLKMMKKKERTL